MTTATVCIDASFIVRFLADTNSDSVYDAHYLALAQRLSIELWTADKRLYNAVKSSLGWVKLLRN